MNYTDIRTQQRELADWLAAREFPVFGTLKYTLGSDITGYTAEAILCKFFNKLDKTYFGSNLVDDGHRIERTVFKHFGASGENLHFHFLAKPNADVAQFCETAKCVWEETSNFTMGYEHTVIEEVTSFENTSHYCLHEYSRFGADTLYLPATHAATKTPNINIIHAQRRLQIRSAKNQKTKQRAQQREVAASNRVQARLAYIAGNTATR